MCGAFFYLGVSWLVGRIMRNLCLWLNTGEYCLTDFLFSIRQMGVSRRQSEKQRLSTRQRSHFRAPSRRCMLTAWQLFRNWTLGRTTWTLDRLLLTGWAVLETVWTLAIRQCIMPYSSSTCTLPESTKTSTLCWYRCARCSPPWRRMPPCKCNHQTDVQMVLTHE